MQSDPVAAVPHETSELIDHILTRYHEVHRAELADLQPLAQKVETVHEDDPDVPRGLANALGVLAKEMEDHMVKEEMILFPAMRAGDGAGLECPIAVMCAEHDDHAEKIALIRQLTGNGKVASRSLGTYCAGERRTFPPFQAAMRFEPCNLPA